MNLRRWIGSLLLIAAVIGGGAALAFWKISAIQAAAAAGANQPEPAETVTVVAAAPHEYRRTTTSIGTVVALRSISLRNENPGMVRVANLTPGKIVEEGEVLIQLNIAVEEAELKALESQATLAETVLARTERLRQSQSLAQEEVDRARAQRDVALAQIAKTKAVINRKTIKAPFKARVGMSDVHPGQFLTEGDHLTTLQGVDDDVHVDFAVNQHVAAGLTAGSPLEVFTTIGSPPIPAKVVAVDAKVDPATRNAQVRAIIRKAPKSMAPGASVRVKIPVGEPKQVVAVPASAVRKGVGGDHVFLITTDQEGKKRAHLQPVDSGALVGDETLIYAGLKVGDPVVASGSFKLREGALVNVASETTAAKTQADTPKTTSR